MTNVTPFQDRRTTKKAVHSLRDEIETRCSGNIWFRRAIVESDDGGPHIELHVTSYEEMKGGGVGSYYPGFRVCVISTERNEFEKEYDSFKETSET